MIQSRSISRELALLILGQVSDRDLSQIHSFTLESLLNKAFESLMQYWRDTLDDCAKNIDIAVPGSPIEILGLDGNPNAGDDFIVVDSDSKAREIAEYRIRKNKQSLVSAKSNVENMFEKIVWKAAGTSKILLRIITEQAITYNKAIAGTIADAAFAIRLTPPIITEKTRIIKKQWKTISLIRILELISKN